jgi:hypothetical protein
MYASRVNGDLNLRLQQIRDFCQRARRSWVRHVVVGNASGSDVSPSVQFGDGVPGVNTPALAKQ